MKKRFLSALLAVIMIAAIIPAAAIPASAQTFEKEAPTCTYQGFREYYGQYVSRVGKWVYYSDSDMTQEIDLATWFMEGNGGYMPPLGHAWQKTEVSMHKCSRCDAEEACVDENHDGKCDICETPADVTVNFHTTENHTKTLKTGSNLSTQLADWFAALHPDMQQGGVLYSDGTPVGDDDIIPYGTENMDLYAIFRYPAEEPSCTVPRHAEYFFNTLDGCYYEDSSCTQSIGKYEWKLEDWIWAGAKSEADYPIGHLGVPCEDVNQGHYCTREDCPKKGEILMHTFNEDWTECKECSAPAVKVCEPNSTYSDFYLFYNEFPTDGSELKYSAYYLKESVTLTSPLVISAEQVRIVIGDGVTLDCTEGYYVPTSSEFEIYYTSRGDNKGTFIGEKAACFNEETRIAHFDHLDENGDGICEHCQKAIASYIDAAGNVRNAACAVLKSSMTTLSSGWYFVNSTPTFFSPVKIDGDVHLILGDSTSMRAEKGIQIPEYSTLAIYSQSLGENMGTLYAKGDGIAAGIGGYADESYCGDIEINGGNITALGGMNSAGIGCRSNGRIDNITINNGCISATGGELGAAAIGSGDGGIVGYIDINGGSVAATGGTTGPGIGAGNTGECSTVTVNNGAVIAKGGGGAAGIGTGYNSECKTIYVKGGSVNATGGLGGAGIGGGVFGIIGSFYADDGTIYATGDSASGIGSGQNGEFGYIGINNVDFLAATGSNALGDEYTNIFVEQSLLKKSGDDAKSAEICASVGYKPKYVEISYRTPPAVFNTMSLTLDGAIGVNFYVKVNDKEYLGEDPFMEIRLEGQEVHTYYLTENKYDEEKGKYKFTFYVNSLQMAENIYATFYYGNYGECITQTASVKTYADYIIENSKTPEAVQLADALLSYGYYAQQALQETHHFTLGDGWNDYKALEEPGGAPDTEIDLSAYEMVFEGITDNENILSLSMTLALDNKTDIYIYLKCTDGYVPKVESSSKKDVTVEKVGTRYKITVPNIGAHELADTFLVDVDKFTIKVSAFSYLYSILSSETKSDNYKYVAAALYEYYKAAKSYVK